MNNILSISLIILLNTFATVEAQSVKGLYVNDFFDIIGDKAAENKLLSYAKSNGFNYLILYNTTKIHRNTYPLDQKKGSVAWNHFIKQSKTDFNIERIGVVGEKAESFAPVIKYNKEFCSSVLECIDVINLEFEFWNKRLYSPKGYYSNTYLLKQGYPSSNEGAFSFYMDQLKEMKKLVVNTNLEIETYIGNPTDAQLKEIANNTDRILIHYYREKTDRIAFYKLNRLKVLQQTNPKLKIAPIFSSRENHSGPWLKTHKIDELPALFFNQLKSAREIDLNSLNFDGYVWYRYSDMPKAN